MPKIIVEVCQNHNGNRSLLQDMIYAAKENGADIIKGQVIFSQDLTPRKRFDEGHEETNGVRKTIKRPYSAEHERLAGLDLTEDDYYFFVDEVNKVGAIPMLTVFSRNRVALAARLPWQGATFTKVASYDCASRPLIIDLANQFDTLIISTGATFDQEIEDTASMLKEKQKNFALLHCVTNYPNTLAMANLNRIHWLRQFASEVGWSDHTLVSRDGIKASKVALMLGANYIERHFTILDSDKTKDGPISITPALLRELADFGTLTQEEQKAIIVKEIPEWEIMLGHEKREMTHTEMLNRDYYRGRFASLTGDTWVYNWEEKLL